VNTLLALIITWLNALVNALGEIVLAPIAVLPGWLSSTIVAAVTGVLLLLVFKHTSNQNAIKRVRSRISANTLALKLFKDSTAVALQAQGRMLAGAFQLLYLALVPMLVMMVPVVLILGQLSLWYQARPLRVGEEAIVTLKYDDVSHSPLNVTLKPNSAVEVEIGPVRVPSKREVCWNIKARQPGRHFLEFQAGSKTATKELAVGAGFMRTSSLRPGWQWEEILLNPGEAPFPPGCPIQAIEVDYPARDSWTSGTNSWIIYWFGVSMIAALAVRRVLNVNL
jgi:uncharacterized membrane protein (DUF106 family)